MDRRKFMKSVGTAGAAAFVLPRFSIASTKSPNSKLNVAFVGVGGVGGMAINGMKSENAVAFCDVDTNLSGWHKKENPKSQFFQDYRVMLDKMGKDIDAVCVSTPDTLKSRLTPCSAESTYASRSRSSTTYGSAASSRGRAGTTRSRRR